MRNPHIDFASHWQPTDGGSSGPPLSKGVKMSGPKKPQVPNGTAVAAGNEPVEPVVASASINAPTDSGPVPGTTAAEASISDFLLPPQPPPSSVMADFNLDEFRATLPTPVATSLDAGISAVRCKRPRGSDFIYVHKAWREYVYIVGEDYKRQRPAYLVSPTVASVHSSVCRRVCLIPYVDDGNNYYLWPIGLEDSRGIVNDYSLSALAQIGRAGALGIWAQYRANLNNQSYDLLQLTIQRPEPKWPAGGIHYLIARCFEDRVIRTVDHPLFGQLCGRLV
jgi:hypothetical protein